MKKVQGRCGTVLNFSLKKLQEQINRLTSLQKNIEVKQKMIDQLKNDENKVNEEVSAARKRVAKIKRLMSTYSVPDAFEYIMQKAEVYDYVKEMKVGMLFFFI